MFVWLNWNLFANFVEKRQLFACLNWNLFSNYGVKKKTALCVVELYFEEKKFKKFCETELLYPWKIKFKSSVRLNYFVWEKIVAACREKTAVCMAELWSFPSNCRKKKQLFAMLNSHFFSKIAGKRYLCSSLYANFWRQKIVFNFLKTSSCVKESEESFWIECL